MPRDDLTTFLRVIPPENRTWQTFDDKRLDSGKPRRNHRLARVISGSLASIEPTLRRLNAPGVGAGAYITGNLTDGCGRRTHNIKRIAAVVADMDDGLPASFSFAPTIIVETSPGRFQAWWALDDGNTITAAEQRDIHARLVHDYGADPRASGIARVYRVPGFRHLKREPFLVRIFGGAMRPVDKAALLEAFPKIVPQLRLIARSQSASTIVGDRHTSDLDRFTAPLKAIPADGYATWITVGLALHAECGGGSDGLAMWDAWSAGSAKFWPGECAARWATFKPTMGSLATGGKIFWLAGQNGWRRPASG